MKKKHIGSSVNNFLEEEGPLKETQLGAAQKILSIPEVKTEPVSVENFFELRSKTLEKLMEEAQKLKLLDFGQNPIC